MWKWLLVLGGCLLAAGVVAGFVPVSASGTSCGAAFHPSDDAVVADYARAFAGVPGGAGDACSSARSTWTVVAWMLLVPGVLLLGGGFVAWVRESP